MSEPTKKIFGSAISGYNRAEVDRHVAWIQKNLADVEQYNSMAIQEQNSLRERILELEEESRKTLDAAENEMQRVELERARLSKDANVIRSDADNYASKVKAELENEVERIQNENASVLKLNAEIESGISEKIVVAEKQALEIFRMVQFEADQMRNEADLVLAAATQEASSLVENAEESLENARREADRMASESQGMAIALISDARARAEAVSMKSLDIARQAIAEAEYRLSKLPQQANAIEAFLEETARMITPDQETILERRKSLNESISKPLEADLVQDEEPANDEKDKN